MSELQPQNFTMLAGDSKVLKVTVLDEAGEPLPLAGTQSVTWRLARTARSVPILSKGLGTGVTLLTANAAQGGANCGRLDIVVNPEDSDSLDGEYFHDCHLVDPSGAHSTIFFGRINITPNLT